MIATHEHFFLIAAGAILLASILAFSARIALGRRLRLSSRRILRRVVPALLVLLPLLAFTILLPRAPLPRGPRGILDHVLLILWIAWGGWTILRILRGVEDLLLAQHTDVRPEGADPSILTQSRLIIMWAKVLVVLLTLGAALMTFPGIRALGASVLASAGLAGVVLGLAARPILLNMLAGLQIALTQPFRLGDIVIVQGEWGRIEEIRATYVVVCLWDQRRFIVPLQWFIENPFQNWTHRGQALTGAVYLWVDYRTPLSPLRAELERLCRHSPEWDGRLVALEVTDATTQAIQLRALVSAADSSRLWKLRCAVREALVSFLQSRLPECLPRWRVDGVGRSLIDASGSDAT